MPYLVGPGSPLSWLTPCSSLMQMLSNLMTNVRVASPAVLVRMHLSRASRAPSFKPCRRTCALPRMRRRCS